MDVLRRGHWTCLKNVEAQSKVSHSEFLRAPSRQKQHRTGWVSGDVEIACAKRENVDFVSAIRAAWESKHFTH